jgi:hypothetical protein
MQYFQSLKTNKPMQTKYEGGLSRALFYLDQTIELINLLVKNSSSSPNFKYKAFLSEQQPSIDLIDSNEALATAEFILCRYTFAYGCLLECKQDVNELSSSLTNMDNLTAKLKHILSNIQIASVRILKLEHLKPVLWGVFGYKYDTIYPELNYHLVTSHLQLFECNFANALLLKIALCHYNSLQ